jgi:putative oxidoreductase
MGSERVDAGLLFTRLALGGVLFAHGAQKLFGWFGGHGLDGTAAAFDQMGFRPGRTSALAAGVGEAGGGALIVAGLATPAAGAAAVGTMAVAAAVHAPAGFFAQQGGYEYPALLGTAAAALAVAGPGRLSLDAAVGHRLNRPWMAAFGLVAGAVGAAVVISRRQQALSAAPAAGADPVDGRDGQDAPAPSTDAAGVS